MTDLAKLELDLINAIGSADSVAALEEVRVAAVGKSGSVSGLLKGMGALSPDERREQGPIINGLRDRVSAGIAARKAELEAAELDARLLAERVDLTLANLSILKTGKARAIRFTTLDAICTVLDCQPGDILEHVADTPPHG